MGNAHLRSATPGFRADRGGTLADLNGASAPAAPQRGIGRIIRAYRSIPIRLYSVARFRIIRGRFLEEIGQFLPKEGRVLEVGCGFGLFALYFATQYPNLEVEGFDFDGHRIDMANKAARALGVQRTARFRVGDARDAEVDGEYDGIYLLDLVHHIPRESAIDLLEALHRQLRPGGVLIVKDVDTRPWLKTAFTWLLDMAMTKGDPPHYWSSTDLTAVLQGLGFNVFRHALVDTLPYPHLMYVAFKEPQPAVVD